MNHLRQPGALTRMEQDLAACRRSLAQLEGKRDSLRDRHSTLEKDVGLAKGRLAVKGEVEGFIEKMQSEAYQRNTRSFETLLTTLVREVLPDAKPIALDLTTERTLPALDISVVGKNDVREDVFHDHGGAINNVIGMGLRLIATVKSGSTKFLALDEPECWTKPDRVPAFFRVLEDAAKRLGVQCVTITHHDAAANFDKSVRISKITGHPEEGADIESDTPVFEWTDDLEGFRYIRLIDFQAFPDATMHLAPGVNAFVGPNDHGKSSVIRALRAVFYGETRDSLIRHSSKGTAVEIGLAAGRVLRFSRELRRNPKNKWSIHEADGSVVAENGVVFDTGTGSSSPPEWLDGLFGIKKQDKLDIHLAHQKFPVFLLDQTPSVRASVLSIGQESGYMRDMLVIQKERNTRDNAIVKDGEREIGLLRETLKLYEALPSISAVLDEADECLKIIAGWAEYIPFITAAQTKLAQARSRLEAAEGAARVFTQLPDDEAIRRVRKKIDAGVDREAVLDRLVETRRRLAVSKQLRSVLEDLPPEAPNLRQTTMATEAAQRLTRTRSALATAVRRLDLLKALPEVPVTTQTGSGQDTLSKLTSARTALTLANERLAGVDAQLATLKDEIDTALSQNGGHCPTCGHAVEIGDLINHSHAA